MFIFLLRENSNADNAGTLNSKERASEKNTEWNSTKQLNEHFKAHIFCWCKLGFSLEKYMYKNSKNRSQMR